MEVGLRKQHDLLNILRDVYDKHYAPETGLCILAEELGFEVVCELDKVHTRVWRGETTTRRELEAQMTETEKLVRIFLSCEPKAQVHAVRELCREQPEAMRKLTEAIHGSSILYFT